MKLLLFSLFFMMSVGLQRAHAVFEVPTLRGPVMDLAQIIDRSDQRELSQLLFDYNKVGKAQIQVLTVDSLADEAIESVSLKVVDAWKLGDAKADNGILFIIAPAERKLRIEVGQGLEGALPDAYARRIIDDLVVPMFRAGRMSDGVIVGVHEIIRIVDKEYADGKQLAEPAGATKQKASFIVQLLVLIFLFLIIGLGKFGGGGGGRRYRGYGGGWGGPTGGTWSGGSGGWSGGGGGFSGGGSSGSW